MICKINAFEIDGRGGNPIQIGGGGSEGGGGVSKKAPTSVSPVTSSNVGISF